MEENKKVEEQPQVENDPTTAELLILFFNVGWETVVGLVANLFGLKRKTVRDRLLVAIIPFILLLTRVLNWLYLFVHYHLGYNIPVTYLTVDTPWLVSFAVGVFFVVALVLELVFIWIYVDSHGIGFNSAAVELVTILLSMLFCGTFNEFEFFGWYTRGCIWLLFFFTVFLVLMRERSDEAESKKGIAIYITVLLGMLLILAICIWRIRNILSGFGLEQYINLNLWGGHAFISYAVVCIISGLLSLVIEQQGVIRFQIFVLFIAAVFSFFLIDDYFSRSAPYAIVENGQQVVVYQSKEISVLEPATTEVDEETNKVILTIDTSQQQIVDSTSLSYEYQSFDTVEIIKAKSDNQSSADDSSISDNEESSAVADIDIDPADTSTDPADGAASYDTSN